MKRKVEALKTSIFFFDPVEMGNCLMNAKTNTYIRQVGPDAFVIGAVQAPLHAFPYDPHLWSRGSIYAAAPHEDQAKRYWKITNKHQFRKRLVKNPELYERLFSEDGTLLTTATFTRLEMQQLTGVTLDESNVHIFDTKCNDAHVTAVERARLTETTFFEWLKGYFENCITSDNLDDIEEAVQALETSAHGKIDEAHSEVLKDLDISVYARTYITDELKQGTLSLNTDADLEPLLTLMPRYSTYAEQYYVQTELFQIVERKAVELRSDALGLGPI